jgi:4-hydroxybutyrate dehydrogenase
MEHPIVEMSYPTRVVFGPGAVNRVPEKAALLGMKKPLVVTDQGIVRAGLAERLFSALRTAKLPFAAFDRVEPNPTEADANGGIAAYRENGCDGVIAIGGGSPLDVGKLVRLLATHPPPLSRYDDAADGGKYVTEKLPAMIALPTTAGTGSEVGRSAVAFLKDTGRKTVIFAPPLMPSVAVCDPELTLGLPPSITAATGMDAFTHCLEAYIALGVHPLADAVAIDGIRRVARNLERAVREGKDLDARSEMMIAAIEGAMAFQKGLGAAHALAHALTPIAGVHHGLANAIVLPHVLDFNRGSVGEKLARVAVAMGDNSVARDEVLASDAIEQVRALCKAIGIPAGLSVVGVKPEMLPTIADKAFADASHLTNPRKVTRDDLFAIAKAAM